MRFTLTLLAVLSILLSAFAAPATAQTPLWMDFNDAALARTSVRWVVPDTYRAVQLDAAQMRSLLAAAPMEQIGQAPANPLILELPMPDGSMASFAIQESPVMAPGLAARYPEIRTYVGQGIDDLTATVRLDFTPLGFHALVISASSTVYIDPYARNDKSHYVVYYKQNLTTDKGYEELGYMDWRDADAQLEHSGSEIQGTTAGPELRTYRLAVGATGEYTQFFDGTVPTALAAIVTSINRVTGVYEREVAVRMILVDNEDLVIFTDPTKDPYTNDDGGEMLGENQSVIDSRIGSANYDVGHVFSTGGGGVAYLGVPCVAGWKAQGVTGSPSPVGDAYDIDYVAHEMGHQFGANHTFNGTKGSCSGGNRNASTAYEPGSATTIMGYAGICGTDDIQPHSDDYFHVVSFDEMVDYTTNGDGNTCPVITNTGNHAPTVEAGTVTYTIPKSTPFTITGSATDSDGDALTYCWEQWDLGPAGAPNSPSGNAPIFRSFNPVTVPSRTFPQISDIVNNTQTKGEILPSYARTLHFRLTARDNKVAPGAGGVGYDAVAVNVNATAGPFLVTAPNTAVTWNGGTSQTVTWNVAGTAAAPISCANVNIDLSTDGGYTYPTSILAGTPNDGTQAVTVPMVNSTQARVRVSCAGNIFFDISNANFTITAVENHGVSLTPAADEKDGLIGNTVVYTMTVENTGNVAANMYLSANPAKEWTVDISPAVINGLAGGATATVLVTVHVPGDVVAGTEEATTIYVYDEAYPSANDTSLLVTTAVSPIQYLFMPVIVR